MPDIPSNFRPDFRPIGGSGSFLRSRPNSPYGLAWGYITDSDVNDNLRFNSITISPSAVLVGTGIRNPQFTISYLSTPSGTIIESAGTGTQVLTYPFISYVATGVFPTGLPNTSRDFYFTTSGVYGMHTSTGSINFYQLQFWGVGNTGTYSQNFIKTLSNSGLARENNLTINLTPGSNQHIFYAFRSDASTPIFKYNNLYGGFQLASGNIPFTNHAGFTENYNLYRSDYSNLGSVSIIIGSG